MQKVPACRKMPLLMTLAHFVRIFKLLFGVEEQIDEIIRSFSTGWLIFEQTHRQRVARTSPVYFPHGHDPFVRKAALLAHRRQTFRRHLFSARSCLLVGSHGWIMPDDQGQHDGSRAADQHRPEGIIQALGCRVLSDAGSHGSLVESGTGQPRAGRSNSPKLVLR